MNRFTPSRLIELSLTMAMVFSGAAHALTPADGVPDLTLYIPGSQANDPVLGFMVGGSSIVSGICADPANPSGAGTTTHVYFHSATAGAAGDSAAVNDNYSAIYCLTSSAKLASILGSGNSLATTGTYAGSAVTDSTAKIKVWVSRRRLGASAVGLAAASTNSPLTFLDGPTTCGVTLSGGTPVLTNGSYSSGGSTFQWNYTCHNVASTKPTGATGDVTPDVMGAEDNTVPNTDPIDYTLFNSRKTVAGHIIGTPITLKLYQALQLAGIASGALPSDCGLAGQGITPVSSNASGENAACQPNLTRAQLASIFSGTFGDWSAIKVKLPTTSTTAYTFTDTDAAPNGTDNVIDLPELVSQAKTLGFPGTGTGNTKLDNPRDTVVHVCRRENGAGQQVAVLANILQYPCLGDHGPRIADTGNTPADVMYATSLGAVDNCLKDMNDGSNAYFSVTGTANERHNPAPYNDYRDIPQDVAHGNQWGISIQTTERNASRGSNYRFIKIDGASPTGKEVALNRYPLVGEYTFSWKTSYNTTNFGATKGGDVNKLQNALAKLGQLSSTVAARNTSLSNHGWGQAGYIALSANVVPPASWNPANPVTPYKREVAGSPDACALPTVNPAYNTLSLPFPPL